ncbi:ABC transporter ATP-binding protein [Neptuniibacter sp. QD48_11]|uniref:ABC transporter ATP-binding protein n=1 Tax=unclassified Neptuniibacter TaxID=2630693 RepID=UPI0039F5504F
MPSAVEIDALTFRWNRHTHGITVPYFELKQAESVFIKGPSGSGKSTLLNLLGGMIAPSSGSIKILEQDVGTFTSRKMDRFRADHIGFIFQQFNLLPHLDLIDNVALPCHFSASRKTRAEEKYGSVSEGANYLLQELGLGDSLTKGRKVLALSTGQQQRVAVARAMLGSPELIIADEPTSALDTEHRDMFMQLLCKQCESVGAALMMVSHDPNLEQYFSRVERLVPSTEGGFAL